MYYTFISKKQIGVIFSNWKKGNLNLTEDQIKWLYDRCAERKGFKNDFHLEDVLRRVRSAIDCIFANDLKEAENCVIGAYDLYHACFCVK